MLISLDYGRTALRTEIGDNNISQILLPNELNGVSDPLKAVEESMQCPLGSASLEDIIQKKRPSSVVIIVNDVTRPTPCEYLLPPIFRRLAENGIKKNQVTLLVATGLHKPNTYKQNLEIFGEEILRDYRLISHKADESELVNYGVLDTGTPLYVNKIAAEADLLITIGVILPHYFAGFSGGRKSILPGVCGRETIQKNHSRLVDLMDDLPPLKKNPVNLEMISAARLVGVDFIINVVPNSKGEIVKVVSGDLESAWYAGTEISSKMYEVPIKELVDVVIVSANGYPRDINAYQTQKALDHADRATRTGGSIILVSECIEGLGEPIFQEWMEKATSPEEIIQRIKEEFIMGGHKAYGIAKVAKNKKILWISSMNENTTNLLFAEKCATLDNAIRRVRQDHGDSFSCVVMPQGSLTVPFVN